MSAAKSASTQGYFSPKPKLRWPPSVTPFATPKHAPNLTRLYVGCDWPLRIKQARQDFATWQTACPALALPTGQDPREFRWPVKGRNVVVVGVLPELHVKRLFIALLRDGATVAAAMNAEGVLMLARGKTP